VASVVSLETLNQKRRDGELVPRPCAQAATAEPLLLAE